MSGSLESLKLLTVVTPCFNEASVVDEFYDRTVSVLAGRPYDLELLFVDVGSTDGTFDQLLQLQQADDRVSIVKLSRNFGKEVAMTAALHHATGDVVVVGGRNRRRPP